MMKIIKYCLLVICVIITGCQKKKGLELELLNNQVHAYCPGGDCNNYTNRFVFEDYYKKSNNVIKFKITNHDDHIYMFAPINEEVIDRGNAISYYFSTKFLNANHNNFIIYNQVDNEISKSNYILSYREESKVFENYVSHSDSIFNEYYNHMGYGDKSKKWKFINSELTNKSIIIHPGESLYFETNIKFPFNQNIINSSVERVLLKKDINYKVRLRFKTNIKNIEDWLTESQLKNFKMNNYQFYNKELISSNEVDLIIKEIMYP